jgi:hypothetical protein
VRDVACSDVPHCDSQSSRGRRRLRHPGCSSCNISSGQSVGTPSACEEPHGCDERGVDHQKNEQRSAKYEQRQVVSGGVRGPALTGTTSPVPTSGRTVPASLTLNPARNFAETQRRFRQSRLEASASARGRRSTLLGSPPVPMRRTHPPSSDSGRTWRFRWPYGGEISWGLGAYRFLRASPDTRQRSGLPQVPDAVARERSHSLR